MGLIKYKENVPYGDTTASWDEAECDGWDDACVCDELGDACQFAYVCPICRQYYCTDIHSACPNCGEEE